MYLISHQIPLYQNTSSRFDFKAIETFVAGQQSRPICSTSSDIHRSVVSWTTGARFIQVTRTGRPRWRRTGQTAAAASASRLKTWWRQ